MIWAHVTASLRETFYARRSEWAAAVMLLNCGAMLKINDGMFASDSAYNVIAALAHQQTWGTLCVSAGTARLIVLAINGLWRHSPHARAFSAFISCLFWFLISFGFIQAGVFGFVTAIVPVLLMLDSYNVVRAIGEGATSDAHHAHAKQGQGNASSFN